NVGEAIVVPTRELREHVRTTIAGGPPADTPPPVRSIALPEREEPGSVRSEPPELSAAPPLESADSSKPGRMSRVGADGASGFVKIDTRKLDSLVELVGE